jgi:hypothetical protein
MSAKPVVVRIRSISDGDATHRPTNPKYVPVDPPTIYLEKVAQLWMKDRGDAIPGIKYILDRLPTGYALYQRARGGGQGPHVDKWLYGHPGHKKFDSPNRFYVHFKHIMETGDSLGCPCTVCNAVGGRIPPLGVSAAVSSNTSQTMGAPQQLPKGRPKLVSPGMDSSRVDEEGTPDVYRNLIDKLKKNKTLDEAITEPLSMDWRAEQECIPTLLKKLAETPQYRPRAGEIVLFVRELPGGAQVLLRKKTGAFEVYDTDAKEFLGPPRWEAGLVGQTPIGHVDLEDLISEPEKEASVSYTGVRVEPLPDPNSTDKSLSKRYTYVPMHHVRPFILWKEYLHGVLENKWHRTIKNALTAMSTFSLVGKHQFRGKWPGAWIFCHAMYIGSEMIAVGDTVRLLPKAGSSSCTDVLTINSIRVKLSNLDKASDNDYDEGRPYNSSVHIFGKGYTTDQYRSDKQWFAVEGEAPPIARTYAADHPLHPVEKEMMVPLARVLGRLFEDEAMTLWLPCLSNTAADNPFSDPLNIGREGVVDGRAFGRANDKRIAETFGATWYWGDSRAQALDLQTINGLEVGIHDNERDPKAWRTQIKVMQGIDEEGARVEQKTTIAAQRSLRGFMAPPMDPPLLPAQRGSNSAALQKLPVRSESRPLSEGSSGSGSPSTTASRSGPSTHSSIIGAKKRSKIIDLSDEEDDLQEVTHRQMSTVGQSDLKGKKKAKVMVVID